MKIISSQISNNEFTCKRKVRYRTLKRCLNAMKNIKKIHSVQIKGFHTDAYHCKFCDGWHFGNKTIIGGQNDCHND